jgi:Glycine zipper 2TM domain
LEAVLGKADLVDRLLLVHPPNGTFRRTPGYRHTSINEANWRFVMTKSILAASVALAALVPSVASAQSCERHRSGRIAGTVIGAGGGALLGSVIAGRGDKTEGAVIGGVVGAIAGNQIAKPDQDCRRAYGYFDKDGRWHATGIQASDARGYFDRSGDWVEGRPSGYYDGDRWIAYNGDTEAGGYVDSNGYWVPVGAMGYYDRDNRWIAGSTSGYYDSRGRWVAGPVRGRYDSNGRWIAGDPGYGNNANWSSIEQPGYYDQSGRWVAGRTYGYYDARGRWVAANRPGYGNNDQGYDANRMPTDLDGRIAWLRDYVRTDRDRQFNRSETNYAMRELNAIDSQHRTFARSGGRLTVREEATLRTRLDRLTRRLDISNQQARGY